MHDIANALKDAGHEVPKSQIVQTITIKSIGEYPVRVTLHPEVVVTILLNVARIEAHAA